MSISVCCDKIRRKWWYTLFEYYSVVHCVLTKRKTWSFFSLVINNESVEMWLQLITTERTPALTPSTVVRGSFESPPTLLLQRHALSKWRQWRERKKPLKREMMHALWAWWIVVVLSLIDINFLISRSRFADTRRNRIIVSMMCSPRLHMMHC